jgi:phage-related protein
VGNHRDDGDVNPRIGDLRAEINTRFSDLDGDVGNLRSDVREMGERLRNVEIQFAKVDQRLLTLERAIIGRWANACATSRSPAADSDE